jgi:hypothetical protein
MASPAAHPDGGPSRPCTRPGGCSGSSPGRTGRQRDRRLRAGSPSSTNPAWRPRHCGLEPARDPGPCRSSECRRAECGPGHRRRRGRDDRADGTVAARADPGVLLRPLFLLMHLAAPLQARRHALTEPSRRMAKPGAAPERGASPLLRGVAPGAPARRPPGAWSGRATRSAGTRPRKQRKHERAPGDTRPTHAAVMLPTVTDEAPGPKGRSTDAARLYLLPHQHPRPCHQNALRRLAAHRPSPAAPAQLAYKDRGGPGPVLVLLAPKTRRHHSSRQVSSGNRLQKDPVR